MDEVELYITDYDGEQRAVLNFIHQLMMDIPEVYAKINYGIPFYYRKSWICYLNPVKNGKVDFAFTRGNELSNQNGLLESRNRKQVMSITFEKVSDINVDSLVETIQEAIVLDEKVPYAAKR